MITLFCIRPRGFNIGNEAIFVALQPFLHRAFGEVVNLITLPATARYETDVRAGLTPTTVYDINQYGHGVIVGGGNLYENGEIDVHSGALDALEVPLMLFSLSRGRIYNRRNRLVVRTNTIPPGTALGLNRKALSSLARDKATLHYLHGLGAEHARLGGCPTLFLRDAEHRLPALPVEKEPPVLISVRNPQLMSIPLRKQIEVHGDIGRMIAFLRAEGHSSVKLLCHDHRDITFAASFPDIDFIYTDDVFTYLALLRSCRLNITYRMHSALPCLSFGTPTIKISYDERAASLMDTIGFGEWNVNMIEGPPLLDTVIDRYRRLGELDAIKEAAVPIWRTLHESMTAEMARFARAVRGYRDEVAR